MAYLDICTGTVDIDQSDTNLSSGWDIGIIISRAIGQKFKPTSKCLKKVVVNLDRELDNDMYLEIRKTLTSGNKLPMGNPQESAGRIAYQTIPYSSIPTTGGEVEVVLDAILDDYDVANGIWIVLCLYVYDPSVPSSDVSCIVKAGNSYNTEYRYNAVRSGNNPWSKQPQGNIYFRTFKQSLIVPTCPQPAMSMTIPS